MTEQPLSRDEISELIRLNTEKVFSTMLALPLEPFQQEGERSMMDGEGGVVSLVGFAGEWSGTGSISCGESLARSLSGKLLMTEFDSVNEEVLDAMGEIANMIIGNFKDDAACSLGPLGLSTPTVIYGSDFQARNWNGQSWITVPFHCDGELFEVRVCLTQNRSARSPSAFAGVQ